MSVHSDPWIYFYLAVHVFQLKYEIRTSRKMLITIKPFLFWNWKEFQNHGRHLPPATLGGRLRFCSLLNAEPVFSASNRLSITPSWSSGALKSTSVFFFAALSALSRSCLSRASLALINLSAASRSLMIFVYPSYWISKYLSINSMSNTSKIRSNHEE